jgi:hypothetical protein
MRSGRIMTFVFIALAALLVHTQCYAVCLSETLGSAECHHHHGGDCNHHNSSHHEDAACMQHYGEVAGPQVAIVMADELLLPPALGTDSAVTQIRLLSRFETGSPPRSAVFRAVSVLRI